MEIWLCHTRFSMHTSHLYCRSVIWAPSKDCDKKLQLHNFSFIFFFFIIIIIIIIIGTNVWQRACEIWTNYSFIVILRIFSLIYSERRDIKIKPPGLLLFTIHDIIAYNNKIKNTTHLKTSWMHCSGILTVVVATVATIIISTYEKKAEWR